MTSMRAKLTELVSAVVADLGYDPQYGEVVLSNRPDLSQFQCNGALPAAKKYGRNPRELAQEIADKLQTLPVFAAVSVAGPGFINLALTDAFLVEQLQALMADPRRGYAPTTTPRKFIVDYGGANVAKPMHIGHLRAAIIGESVKRLAHFAGHHVLGDVHLGDWGL